MYLCTMAKINRDTRIIVSRYQHDISNDGRILIPFYQGTKIGFIDKDENIIVEPQFDFVLDDFVDKYSLARVGIVDAVAYDRKTIQPTTSLCKRFGLLKSNGEFLLPMEYEGLCINDVSCIITIRSLQKGYAVIDWNGKEIVPFGKYNYIDGFDYGFARIKTGGGRNGLIGDDGLWGIINEDGKEVVPPKYKSIENFYKDHKPYPFIRVEGFDRNFEFLLDEGRLTSEGAYMEWAERMDRELECYREWKEDQAKQAYEAELRNYSGSYAQDVMGYSDEEINDAFDGDPDAYWNHD